PEIQRATRLEERLCGVPLVDVLVGEDARDAARGAGVFRRREVLAACRIAVVERDNTEVGGGYADVRIHLAPEGGGRELCVDQLHAVERDLSAAAGAAASHLPRARAA